MQRNEIVANTIKFTFFAVLKAHTQTQTQLVYKQKNEMRY